jgi:hypothetical protein
VLRDVPPPAIALPATLRAPEPLSLDPLPIPLPIGLVARMPVSTSRPDGSNGRLPAGGPRAFAVLTASDPGQVADPVVDLVVVGVVGDVPGWGGADEGLEHQPVHGERRGPADVDLQVAGAADPLRELVAADDAHDAVVAHLEAVRIRQGTPAGHPASVGPARDRSGHAPQPIAQSSRPIT